MDDAALLRPESGPGLVFTVDFITPVVDEPEAFGAIAAANALSDVYAMGGEPMVALAVAGFPDEKLPKSVLERIFRGGRDKCAEAGCAIVGGHTVLDPELKYGLAVLGTLDAERALVHTRGRPGDALVLTKPLGTGVLINAFKFDRLDAAGLEPALVEMERPNRDASRLALAHGASAATDVTGFGLAGHAWNVARESGLTLEIDFDALLPYPGFHDLVRAGVSTGCTKLNRAHVGARLEFTRQLALHQQELLFDPQTSGGLLVALPAESAAPLVAALAAGGHRAAVVGRAVAGPAGLRVL